MSYVAMVRMRVGNYARGNMDQTEKEDFERVFADWLEDPKLKRLQIFHREDPQEMKDDAECFFRLLQERDELEFIAEGESSDATKNIWEYLEEPAHLKEGSISFRASVNRNDTEVKLVFGDSGKCTVYDAIIHNRLSENYDAEMPVQLMKNHLTVSGLHGEKLTEHTIQELEALRFLTGGELIVKDTNARVEFDSKFLMPAEKEALYAQLNALGQEVVQLEMEPLALLSEDAFYYEIAQFESRKLKVYSMSI